MTMENSENRSFDWFDLRFETRIMLEDFSNHPQIHDWVWIYFYLKEENAWDIILELTKADFLLAALSPQAFLSE